MTGYQIPGAGATPLDYALGYASVGWSVFHVHSICNGGCTCKDKQNCKRPGKHPRTRNGFKGATTDEKKIRRWWKDHPESNVGIAAGKPSGLVVIDVDPERGGNESLKSLQQRLGTLPPRPIVETGGGGRHLY